MPQREHREIDEDGQDDDRPAVVPDEAVHPLEGVQQRHDQPGEHPEVDRPDQVAIDRRQDVEVLGPGKEFRVLRRGLEPRRPVDEMRHRVLCRRDRHRDQAVIEMDRLRRRDERGQEVVIVGAGKAEDAVLRGILRDLRIGNTAHTAIAVENRLRWRVIRSRARHDPAAERRTPLHRRHQLASTLRHRRGKSDHVGRRRDEREFLARGQTTGVLILERERRGRRGRPAPRSRSA